MTLREFLTKLIETAPSRGLDNTDVYIHSKLDEVEDISYKILDISNKGSNDGIYIKVEKI